MNFILKKYFINQIKTVLNIIVTVSTISLFVFFSLTFGIKEFKKHLPNYYNNLNNLINDQLFFLVKNKQSFINFPDYFKENSLKLKKELISLIPDNWATDDYIINSKYGLYSKMSIDRYNDYIISEQFWDQYFINYASKITNLSAQLKKLNIQPIFIPMMPKVFFYPEGVQKFIIQTNRSRTKFLFESYLPKDQLEYFNSHEWIKEKTNDFKDDVTPYAGYHLSHWMACKITRHIIKKINKTQAYISTMPSCKRNKIEGVMWSDGDILKAVEGLKKDRYLKPSYWMPLKAEEVKVDNKIITNTNIGIIGNSWSDNFVTALRLTLNTDINNFTWFYDFSGLSILQKDGQLSIKQNINKQSLMNEVVKQNILIIILDEKDLWLSAINQQNPLLFGLFEAQKSYFKKNNID